MAFFHYICGVFSFRKKDILRENIESYNYVIILQNSSFLQEMNESEFLCIQGNSQETGNKNKIYFSTGDKRIAFFPLHTTEVIRIK